VREQVSQLARHISLQAGDAASGLARLREQHSDLALAHAALQAEHERSTARNVTLGGLQVQTSDLQTLHLRQMMSLILQLPCRTCHIRPRCDSSTRERRLAYDPHRNCLQ